MDPAAHSLPNDSYARPDPPPPPSGEQLTYRCERPQPDTEVLAIRGELDVRTAPQLAELLHTRVGSQPRRLVLELSELGFLGAAGITVLVTAAAHARGNNTELVLVTGGNRAVTRAVSATATGQHLPRQHHTVAAALAQSSA